MARRLMLVVLVLIVGVVISSCDFLNPLNGLEVGSFLIADVGSDINAPDWLDNKTLISTTGYSPNLNVLSPNGAIRRTYTMDIADISRMNSLSANADGTLVVFNVRYQGPTYEVDEVELDHADIVLYNIETGVATVLTDSAGGYTGASFLSNTEVVYIEYDDSIDTNKRNRLIKHDLTTGVETVIFDHLYHDGTDNVGDSFWATQGSPDGTKVLLAAYDYLANETSFAVWSATTDEILFDGHANLGAFTSISRGDWVDENTIVIASGLDANSVVSVIDISTATGSVVSEFTAGDPKNHRLFAIGVSPDGTLVSSHTQEVDAAGAHVTNRLFIARIAVAPE